MDDVRFMYMRDPKFPKRVVTVARLLCEDKGGQFLQVATATNKCVSGYWHYNDDLPRQKAVDVFTKKRGREIAAGRLMSEHSYKVYLRDGESPHTALKSFMVGLRVAAMMGDPEKHRDNLPELEGRIAKHYFLSSGRAR